MFCDINQTARLTATCVVEYHEKLTIHADKSYKHNLKVNIKQNSACWELNRNIFYVSSFLCMGIAIYTRNTIRFCR